MLLAPQLALVGMLLLPTAGASAQPQPGDITLALASTGDLRNGVQAMCINATTIARMTKRIDQIDVDIENGVIPQAVKASGLLLRRTMLIPNAPAYLLVHTADAIDRLLTGQDFAPTSVSDRRSTLNTLYNTIRSYSIAVRRKDALSNLVTQALGAVSANDHTGELRALGRLVRGATQYAALKAPILTGQQASTVLADAIGTATYFDPVPVVRRFRARVRVNDLDGAVQFVIGAHRDEVRAKIAKFSRADRRNINNLITTNLSLADDHGDFRGYEMSRTESSGSVSYPISFSPDCDGVWRINDL